MDDVFRTVDPEKLSVSLLGKHVAAFNRITLLF